MDPRFPPLAPPEPAQAPVAAPAVALPRPNLAALPMAEWAVFGGLLVALLLLR